MPRIRHTGFYTIEKPFKIFVFLDQNYGQCFVWKTANTNLKSVFEQHYFLHRSRTKKMFERGKENGSPPEMYVLEDVLAVEADAFKHCIAWTKYFMEHGYDSVNYEIHKQYTSVLDEETQKIYDGIKHEFLSDVCAPSKKLFENYGKIRKKRDVETPSNISIVLTPEEYEQVKKNAAEYKMTPAAYAKKMTLEGEIKLENYSFFLEYKDSLRVIERRISGILKTIYETGVYSPADLEQLQQLCDQVGEVHQDAMMIFKKRKYRKRARKK